MVQVIKGLFGESCDLGCWGEDWRDALLRGRTERYVSERVCRGSCVVAVGTAS